MSTPLEPARCRRRNVLTSAVWCRRAPFTRTSVWSGTEAAKGEGPHDSVAIGDTLPREFTDGDNDCKIWVVSLVPCLAIFSEV